MVTSLWAGGPSVGNVLPNRLWNGWQLDSERCQPLFGGGHARPGGRPSLRL